MQSIERWLYIYRERLHTIYSGGFISTVYKKGLHAVYRSNFTSIGRGFILSIEIWPFIYRKGLLTGFREMALYL